MSPEAEAQLLSEVRTITSLFTGTVDKPGLNHTLVEFKRVIDDHEERLSESEKTVKVLNDEHSHRVARDRWLWPKLIALATAIPGVIELVKFFKQHSPNP